MGAYIIDFINIAFEVYTWLIIIRIILSWIKIGPNTIVRFIFELTEPVLAIFRRIVPNIGMLDISPIVAVFALEIIRSGVVWLLSSIVI